MMEKRQIRRFKKIKSTFLTFHCNHLNHSLMDVPSHNTSEMLVCLGGKKGHVSLEQSSIVFFNSVQVTCDVDINQYIVCLLLVF